MATQIRETAQLTTDYPVLAARVGDNQLEFDPATVERTISEGAKDRNVGARVTAMGNHGAIRYTLAGTDADEFEIDDKTGQITTAVDLNFEATGGADNQCATANECVCHHNGHRLHRRNRYYRDREYRDHGRG